MRLHSVGLLVFLLSGCYSSTAPTVPLNQEFMQAPGDSAAIAGTSIVVRFVGVDSDSRCPADVVCVQAGDAKVSIEVRSTQGTTAYELHTRDLEPVVHDGLTIALVKLEPYPFTTRTIQPGDYRATLRVTK